jgi:sugar lactone lactonase YvrE
MVGPGREGDDMAKHTKSGTPGRAGKGRVSATVALSGIGTGLGGAPPPPSWLYWSDNSTISAANLDGGNPQTLLSAPDSLGVAVDASRLYWSNQNDSTINVADLDGSNPQTILTIETDLMAGVAVDASQIYWVNWAAAGTIRAANLDGGNPRTLVTGQSWPFGLAVDASHLYWTNSLDGTIWRANLDGTNAQSIVQGEGAQTSLFALAVDANHLYWTNRSQGTVKRADLDGTNPQTLLGGQNQPQAIAVDGNYVYWSNLGDQNSAIWRANLDGTNPQVFLPNTSGPQLMAITPPRLGFTPSPYDFGEVRTREAASQSFTLANSGGRATGPLTVTVAGSATFTTTGDTCTGTSLAQGASCTVTVSFGPTSFGAVTATLTGASQNPAVSATAALTGTGVGHLYWINEGQTATDGSINLANPDGSNAVTLTSPAGALPFPQGVAVNANLLYVSVRGDLDNDPEFEPFILSAENDNFDSYSRLFVFQTSGQDGQVPQQLAINANNPNDLFWKSGDGRIWRGNINNETFQNIFPQQPPQARGMMVDANYVYWSTFRALQGDGTIWRANLDGTNTVQLAQNQDAPQGLAVDANHLYWTNTGGGTIMRANLDGALPQPIVANQDVPVGVAVDATHLYWTNVGNPEVADGTIWRANLDGTNPQQIISGQNNPVAIAIGS